MFAQFPMGDCFRCCFRQLFISLALGNFKVRKIILVQGFCRLKTEIARFPIGFRPHALS